jgi:ubiquinone biosynthesis protein
MKLLHPPEFLRPSPAQFRRFLQERGPIFTKLGQYLALRPDILPQTYCDELMQLLDRVPLFPWAEARTILTQELGRAPSDVFRYIDTRPAAAGSLAQVHRALLKDGTEVAVKVQRPRVEEQVRRTLKRARTLARVLEAGGVQPGISPREVVDELAEWLLQELDFRRELANLTRLHGLAIDSAVAQIPRPYPQLSTARVLTSEYLHGISFTDLLKAIRPGANEEARPVDAPGIDFRALTRNLVVSTLEQVFHYQFFHADLHPGNLFALPGNLVGYVDFGLCDELDRTVRASQLRYLSAVYFNDREAVFKALTEILIAGEQTDLEAFRRDFEAVNRELDRRSGWRATDPDAPEGSPFGNYLVGLMRAARRNQLQIPARVLALYRAILTMETLARQFRAGDEVRRVGQMFLRRLQLEDLLAQAFDTDKYTQIFISLLGLMRNGPRQLNQILSEVADGSFSLKLQVAEASRAARSQNQRARLLTAAILTVSVTLLLLVPDLPRPFGVSLSWPLAAVLVLLYSWIAFLWGRLK